MKENLIVEKSFNFSLKIIELFRYLTERKEYVLSKQLLRSGTSIGANVNEATAAASRKDFINKMTLASKEARETIYWLKLLEKSQLVSYDYTEIMEENQQIIKILTSIVKTSSNALDN